MKLFAFTLMQTPDSSINQIENRLAAALKKTYKEDASVKLSRYCDYSVIEAIGNQVRFSTKQQLEALYQLAAETAADWVIQDEEEKRLRQLIVHEFQYDKAEDIREILSYLKPELSEDRPEQLEMRTRRNLKVSQQLFALLKDSKDLNLSGFMRFRFHDYMQELREIVEYAVDEFLMDRQYKEFISLLQYFVYIQEAKIPFAHLIHKGGNEFELLNDRMENIDTSETNATLTMELLEKDVNFEDLIVSTLISVSPQLIYIHTRDPDQQIIQTISQIFENRVELCEYCGLCHNLDRFAVSDYNKS
ncbi:putative sporulation protein YtxC [Paenibacillus sp. 1_12]|uniref:putative sporulation protein YtxC n=1 Tax=Paenibacillus sp. 1_12 TaxID=1566278 RepID=UPI0008DED7B2|nr:putative sporulation protein YtxC [Paenibacillus sp. 1_12]SFL14327.1 putative sporulation protein YtxC [Paenibacillus sp. 1_12]